MAVFKLMGFQVFCWFWWLTCSSDLSIRDFVSVMIYNMCPSMSCYSHPVLKEILRECKYL